MKGRFQASGTFEASGGGAGPCVLIAAVVAGAGVLAWLAARLWWIIGTAAAIAVLAAGAVWWLIRRQQRIEADHARQRPFITNRPGTALPRPGMPPMIINIYADPAASAAVIRTALPGLTGRLTEGDTDATASYDPGAAPGSPGEGR